MGEQRIPGLADLARAHGVQTSYRDTAGERRHASQESLLAILAAMGAPVERAADVAPALAEVRTRAGAELLPPVAVAWIGAGGEVAVHAPDGATMECTATLEDGGERAWTAEVHDGRLALPADLPPGYHTLEARAGRKRGTAHLIASPRRASPGPWGAERTWGAFLPLYALRTGREWGMGDLTDLRALMELVGERGGALVGTLPLLAAYLGEEPYEPSPYAPVSRRFWNETYLDPERIPGYAASGLGQAVVARMRDALASLREQPLVCHQRVAGLKRSALTPLADEAWDDAGPREPGLRRFLAERPEVETYARFRAAIEAREEGWTRWPERMRAGDLRPGDYDESAARYHAFAQWAMQEQLTNLAGNTGARLYLDLALGVHPEGYDTWREPGLFAQGVSVGAPPDPFFTGGQNWGFPPLSPPAMRADGHRHLREVLAHHLRFAAMLRIDHVMGLHRLFWIPPGMSARDGVYVRYPADELWAVVCIESERHRAGIVGEDLGTVPRAVRSAMGRHGARRMYVLPFEIDEDPERPVRPPQANAVAGLNTHDLPPFAAFWEGLDIDDTADLGGLDDADAAREKAGRAATRARLGAWLRREGLLEGETTATAAAGGALRWLASSRARTVLVNLEDLWGETARQNTPGTVEERPNWKRKAALTLEEVAADPTIAQTMADISARRRGGGGRR